MSVNQPTTTTQQVTRTNHFLAKTNAGAIVEGHEGNGAHIGHLLATIVTEPSLRPVLFRSIPEVRMPAHYPRTVGDIRLMGIPCMKQSEREKRTGRACAYICWNLGATGKGIFLDRGLAVNWHRWIEPRERTCVSKQSLLCVLLLRNIVSLVQYLSVSSMAACKYLNDCTLS